jgi:hypothetical protein
VNVVESVASPKGPARTVGRQTGSESTGPLAVQKKALRDALASGVGETRAEPGGVLASQRKTLRALLAQTGFINLVGSWRDNFQTYLSREPFGIEVVDITPAMAGEIAAEAATRISESPIQAQQAQAQVQPTAAVKLLT